MPKQHNDHVKILSASVARRRASAWLIAELIIQYGGKLDKRGNIVFPSTEAMEAFDKANRGPLSL